MNKNDEADKKQLSSLEDQQARLAQDTYDEFWRKVTERVVPDADRNTRICRASRADTDNTVLRSGSF